MLSGKLTPHYQIDPKDSWLLAAAERNLPLFVPGWEDSTLGNIYAARCIDGHVKHPTTIRSRHRVHDPPRRVVHADHRRVYNVEYFSGCQVAVYIGDIYVDEITSIGFEISQARAPIYGYASRLFDAMSEGNVLVQGTFTINFKEAGYLWLVLNRYREMVKRPLKNVQPYHSKDEVNRQNIERILNSEVSTVERNRYLASLAGATIWGDSAGGDYDGESIDPTATQSSVLADLQGYPNVSRAIAPYQKGILGKAENIFEEFENQVWQRQGEELDELTRRCDDPALNPFDIYIVYGDFVGSDYDNHTIQRLRNVYITGTAKQVVIDGNPVQEQYTFFARNIV